MAQYKNKKNNTWFIVCRNPNNREKTTTIRVNPKSNQPFQTKKEAKEYEAYFLKSKINLSITLNELTKMYVEEYLALNPSSSGDSIKSWYKNNIKNELGNRKVSTLRVGDLERLALKMKNNNYSVNYINKMTALIKTILNYGVSHEIVDRNPVLNYKPLKKIKTSETIRYWTPDEFKQIISSIPQCYKKANHKLIRQVLIFGYFSGLRKSEIRALQWNQVDFQSNVLYIDYHMNNKNERVIGRKNGNGYSIYMDTNLRSILLEVYSTYKNVEGFTENAFVFPSEQQGFSAPLGDHTPTRWVDTLAKYNHLNNPTFHGLRHSFCSYVTSVVGLSPYEVADRLGDTVEVVLSTYHDFFKDQKITTANKIDEHHKNFEDFIKIHE